LLSGIGIRENLVGTEKVYAGTAVIVLSHGCDIDKKDTNAILCAQTRPLAKQKPQFADAIRRGDVINAMYLPQIGILAESYVDFRLTHRVSKVELEKAMHSGRRIASLSADGQMALHVYLFRFFTRTDLNPLVIRVLSAWDALKRIVDRRKSR